MAERRDRRGRRRTEGQERGLRPLYPLLPLGWLSRALRISMPAARWQQFDALLARERTAAPTEARAAGQLLMNLMDAAETAARGRHWLDWEREKTLRLLRESHKLAS
jgi:hypothetical protein